MSAWSARAMAAAPSRPPAARARENAPLVDARSAGAQPSLGPPPLVQGEDEGAYAGLLARVQAAIAPRDVLEEFWVRDIVDLSWEAVRLRRMKANLITAATGKALERILSPLVDESPSDGMPLMFDEKRAPRLAAGWRKREK